MPFIVVLTVVKPKKTHGFTLIELIVLISIMSILLAIGLVKMPSVDLFKTHTFSNVLLSDLRLTQALSMSQNERYRLVIGASSYQIQDQNGVAISHPETSTSSIGYPTGVSITPTMTLMFDSLGKPYDSTGTALSTALTLTVSSTGSSHVVTVSPQTGFVQ